MSVSHVSYVYYRKSMNESGWVGRGGLNATRGMLSLNPVITLTHPFFSTNGSCGTELLYSSLLRIYTLKHTVYLFCFIIFFSFFMDASVKEDRTQCKCSATR